jgi:hypothetical protein
MKRFNLQRLCLITDNKGLERKIMFLRKEQLEHMISEL